MTARHSDWALMRWQSTTNVHITTPSQRAVTLHRYRDTERS
ncbi:hypothetical protein HMPREF1861_00452 [Corynebacterium kroppenstedtii]|nr:hypothetical protein HMPREF1861_00452 [Corynebacterium kroppenstedtii]